MIKPMIVTGFFAVLGIGTVLAPVGVSAKSAGGHQSAHVPSHVVPPQHQRINRNRFYAPYYYGGYRGYGNYGPTEAYAPPPEQKPAAEVRRECEPKTYTVPAADGGESKVTIVRC